MKARYDPFSSSVFFWPFAMVLQCAARLKYFATRGSCGGKALYEKDPGL
jgi:hypothetical protein